MSQWEPGPCSLQAWVLGLWNTAELDSSSISSCESTQVSGLQAAFFLMKSRKERVPHVTTLVLGTDLCRAQDVKGFWLWIVVQKVWKAAVWLAGL